MPTVERIETWRGQDVMDSAGEKAGRLEEVYYDADAREPVLLLIKHGMIGHNLTLIPAAEAVLCRDYLRVPYDSDQINQAKSEGADELNAEQVTALCTLFNATTPSTGPVYSASLIERRRVEAEKARRQAEEAELEAHRRAEELDEARKRAGAAADDAQAAERARQEADAATLDTPPQSPAQP